MRKLAVTILALGLGLALCPDIADAALHGGFPAGARLYGFGGPPSHNAAKVEAPKPLPKLAGPLDYLSALDEPPARPLDYPFLTSPRCPAPSAANIPCAAPDSPTIGGTAGQSTDVR